MRWIFVLVLALGVRATWVRDEGSSGSSEEGSSEERRPPTRRYMTNPVYTPQRNPPQPFRVVTGPIRENSGEGGPPFLPQHVDFDELFPGQDQVAMSDEHGQNIWREPPPPISRVPVPEEDDEVDALNDDLVVPDFSTMFAQLPPVGGGHPSWWQPQWTQLLLPQSPTEWWKGSNVCIKREERVEGGHPSGSGSGGQTLVLNSSAAISEGHPDVSFLTFSACEHLDTRYSCQTQRFGPGGVRTVTTTDYECCSGYALDAVKARCARGVFESVLTTMERMGEEFIRLARHSAPSVMTKLRAENLTLFLPGDAALRERFPSSVQPLRRNPRNILRHPKNEAGGRNVRRGGRPNTNTDAGEMYPVPYDEMGDYEDTDNDDIFVVKKLDEGVGQGEEPEGVAETLLNHLVAGRLSTDDFVDEKVIFSENGNQIGSAGSGGVLRLNTWTVGSESVKTVNCAVLTSPNHRCTNGVIHVVDRVISPVRDSIWDVLTSRPELREWSTLVTSLPEAQRMLRDPAQHLTLFAPTNAALQQVNPALLLKLRSGDSCLQRIVLRHVLPYTFCSSIIRSKGQIRTIEHQILDVERQGDRVLINGSSSSSVQLVTRDIVTTNGVVHVIDALILSDSDKPVTEVIRGQAGLSAFAEALRSSGLDKEIDGMSNLTVFAPSDTAFAELSQEIKGDPKKLRDVLRYHIVKPEVRACHFSHQGLLPTLLGNSTPLRINLYSSFPPLGQELTTASCAVLRGPLNLVGCGGVVHGLDRVLLPPSADVLSTLKTLPRCSIFSRLLSENDELFRSLKNRTGFFTLFVPTDAAFHALPQPRLGTILNSKEEAERVLKRHISSESLCCAGVAPNLFFMTKRVTSLGPMNVPVYRDSRGQVVFGHGVVTSCDLMATNGIIHTVDKVLVDGGEEGTVGGAGRRRGSLYGPHPHLLPLTLPRMENGMMGGGGGSYFLRI